MNYWQGISGALGLALAVSGWAAAEDVPRFGRDVLPILSNNCFHCHGPDEGSREAGLRLDVREAALGALGDTADTSELIARVIATDPLDQMPPPGTGKRLEEAEVAVLRAWIDGGAPYETHWAFIPPALPALPEVQDADWPRTAIDHFILAELERAGIAPSPEADRSTLLRRVHLDLTGIPPTAEEARAFLEDDAPDAYERVVDRLLDSPHFGERWGRHWLDGARYADSHGYSIDGARSIWPYRDWVIDAINGDMPFDRFVIEQMAGDLLPDSTQAQKVATGFHRNTMINQEGGVDPEEFRIEALFDRVETTGTVLLAMTMNCVRCHTHKYDPIEHGEYYRLLAFFNNDDEPELSLPTPEQEARIAEIRAEIRGKETELSEYLEESREAAQPDWEDEQTLAFLHRLDAEQRAALATPRTERTPEQAKVVTEVFRQNDRQARRIDAAIRRLKTAMPDVPRTMVLAARDEPRETFVLYDGDFTRPGDRVTPGVPSVLHPIDEDANTRLDLARWLVSRDNPLTARVTVNRFWQHLFGRGIVETEDDFGIQGLPPSHPELLDWMAVTFMDEGWSVKSFLRTVVTSSVYRQQSHARPDLDEVDPRNVLLARQNRMRLDAEIIRDAALAASGVLNPAIGGPSVHPPIPDGVMNLGQRNQAWIADEDENRYRRGMYTFFWRATPHPSLTVFDAPDAQEACTRRNRSNTPLQALTLLNDTAFHEFALALADKLMAEGNGDDADNLARAFWICLGRAPAQEELRILRNLLEEERVHTTEAHAWVSVARTMLNLDEFITRE